MNETLLDRTYKKIRNNKFFVSVVILYIFIINVGSFTEGVSKIYTFSTKVVAHVQNPIMTDKTLIEESRTTAKEILAYYGERRVNEPQLHRDRNTTDENFQKQQDQSQKYTTESVTYYSVNFQPKVARYKEEYLKRGLINLELNSLYDKVNNEGVIERVAMRLNDLSAQLEANIK